MNEISKLFNYNLTLLGVIAATWVTITQKGKDLITTRTISLTVYLPQEPNTRVGLEQQEDKSIDLTWQSDDELQLVFVQEGFKKKATITLTAADISNEGKNAQFDINIPAEITDGLFNLYGVHGGGGLSDDNPTNAILPSDAGSAVSLADMNNKKDVMLYFSCKDIYAAIDAANTHVSTTTQHLGSLFSISLKNTGVTSLDNLEGARIVGLGGNGSWAYNSGNGGKTYDLITGEFQDIETAGNYIAFKAEKNSLSSGETIAFWSWYPPLPNKNWPELQLQLMGTSSPIAISVNTKEARTNPTGKGKVYYFYATWDGSQLRF